MLRVGVPTFFTSGKLFKFERSGDRLLIFINIQGLVNNSWDWFNFSTKFLLNLVQTVSIVPTHQVNSQTQVTKSTGTTNSVQVCFGRLWEIEIDNHINGLDINTSGQQIGTDQVSNFSLSEFVKDFVSGLLRHFSVRVITRVAQLGNFFGQQLNTIGRITEYNGLVDLQLRKQCVETV